MIIKRTILAAAYCVALPALASAQQISPDQLREALRLLISEEPELIVDPVRRAVEADPQFIIDALVAFEDRAREKALNDQIAADKEAIGAYHQELFAASHSPVLGNAASPERVVEFFDYNCSHCRRVATEFGKLVVDRNMGVVLKHLPLLGSQSEEAARVGQAVMMSWPDRYLEFHERMMKSTEVIETSAALKIAEDIGLDRAAVEEQSKTLEVEIALETNKRLAEQLKITGTPGFVVKDLIVRGAAPAPYLARILDGEAKP